MQRSHTITPQAFAERARPATLADCVAGLACEMQFDGVWHGGAIKSARDVEGAKGNNWVATPGATTATPKAQKLAKKEAVDLSTIAATGRFGRVTERDSTLERSVQSPPDGIEFNENFIQGP